MLPAQEQASIRDHSQAEQSPDRPGQIAGAILSFRALGLNSRVRILLPKNRSRLAGLRAGTNGFLFDDWEKGDSWHRFSWWDSWLFQSCGCVPERCSSEAKPGLPKARSEDQTTTLSIRS